MNNKNYSNAIIDFIDNKNIKWTLKFNRILCIITIILALTNLILNLTNCPNFIFIIGIIKNYTYNAIFFILVATSLYFINLENNEKYKYISIILAILTGVYCLLAIISFLGTPLVYGFSSTYQDAFLFLIIFIIYFFALLFDSINKYSIIPQSLVIITIILGFTGFLYYFNGNISLISLALNYLIFIVLIPYVFINTHPKKGFIKYFHLNTTGSQFGRRIIIYTPIVLAVISLIILFLNYITNFPVVKFALVAGAALTIIFVSMIVVTKKFTESDMFGLLTMEELELNKKFFENLIRDMEEGVFVTDKNDKIIYINQYALDSLGLDKSILKTNYLTNDKKLLDAEKELNETKNTLKSVFLEPRTPENIDESVYLTGWITPQINNEQFDGAIFTIFDITSEKEKESTLRHSINEKNMLLSEIHHRVKNNMQIISSLLMIQSHRIQDEKFKEVIKESQQRIKTMALVHEKLYENRDFSKININDYINSLIDDISNSYILEGKINIKTDIDNKVFDLDTLVPLGLIINELITNALKYAFKNRENGNIFIKFNETEKDYFVLTVRDDGVGLIEEKKPEDMGIGSELIKSLTAQLEGTYDIEDNNGVIVTITFNAKTF